MPLLIKNPFELSCTLNQRRKIFHLFFSFFILFLQPSFFSAYTISYFSYFFFFQEQLSTQLAEKNSILQNWRNERDTLVSALEIQLKNLLSSNAEKEREIKNLKKSNNAQNSEVRYVKAEVQDLSPLTLLHSIRFGGF